MHGHNTFVIMIYSYVELCLYLCTHVRCDMFIDGGIRTTEVINNLRHSDVFVMTSTRCFPVC